MGKVFRILAPLLFVLMLVAPALAQSQIIIEDSTGQVDQQAVRQAAQNLTSRGATAAVLVSDQTGSNGRTIHKPG